MFRDRPIKQRSLAASLAFTPALLIAALLSPGSAAAAGPIAPSSACSPAGTVAPVTVTCNIEARVGSITPAGAPGPIAIWGFAPTGQAASLPGPTIIARTGDTVVVTLLNSLPAGTTTSILFNGQPMVPDLTGVGSGASKVYTFTAGTPGTYLYEAGLIPGSQYQVAMGLHGALIVRPAASALQANASSNSTFADEALVVLGEIDPRLNDHPNPKSFDLRAYAPKYFLINGSVYTGATAPITTTGGNKVLLRYLNAGLQHHSMGVLGLRQTVVNDDGNELSNPRPMVAESLAPGQSQDAIVVVPGSAGSRPAKYVLYDAALGLNNSNTAGVGGMVRMINAAGSGAAVDTGPITTAVTVTGTGGPVRGLSATITDGSPTDAAGSTITAAEYFIDTVGTPGSGSVMAGPPGDPLNVSALFAVSALPSGGHVVYVRGRDNSNNWGPVASASFSIDTGGPATTGAIASAASANGQSAIDIAATADDTATGGSTIAAARYYTGITPVAMTLSSTTAPVVGLTATIPASVINALPLGTNGILIQSQDSTGVWGPFAVVSLYVDKSGPVTNPAAATPSDGITGINSTNPAIRVTGRFTDLTPSFVQTGEVFIGATGANGTGVPMVPSDGLFDQVMEDGFADIPLTTIAVTPNSNHLFVHGKDSAGNWGPFVELLLSIDTSAPTVDGLVLTPSTADAQVVTIDGSASDVLTGNHNITAAEFFVDSTDPNGTGTPMTVATAAPATTITGTIPGGTVAGLPVGNHVVSVHARDAAGNWGSRVNVNLTIERVVLDTTPPTFTGITLDPGTIYAGTSSVALTVNGADDGPTGSVVSGEFWIGETDIAPGTGTAFPGTTATVPTGSLVPGTYTVRVRVLDGASNWSTGPDGVRTATLTVEVDTIFISGFNSALPAGWSSRSTTVANRLDTAAAAAVTGARGLRARGNRLDYVQYNFGTVANPATSTMRVRFNFRPNANVSSGKDIFQAATSTNYTNRLIRIRYRRIGALPYVQIQVGNANTNTAWTRIRGGASNNVIEVVWKNANASGPNAGQARLFINGSTTAAQTRTVTATGLARTFRLGSVTATGNSTRMYFDDFRAKRSPTPFGP